MYTELFRIREVLPKGPFNLTSFPCSFADFRPIAKDLKIGTYTFLSDPIFMNEPVSFEGTLRLGGVPNYRDI